MSTATLPIHPDTGLTALGFTSKGRPIWPVLGGDGTGDGNTGDAPPAGDDPGTDPGDGGNVDQDPADTGDGTGDEDTTGSDQPPAGSQSSNPALREARNQAASYRTKAAALEQQLADAKKSAGQFDALKQSLGKAFGFVEDDENPDPKALVAKLDAAAKTARESQTHLAVYKLAGKKGVDADALLDSNAFTSALGKLDPDSDDFAAQVGAEITKAVDKNPRYKLAPQTPPPPARSGSDTGAGQGEASGQLTYAQYKALPPAKRIEAVKAGRCKSFLGGTSAP
ncbi:hypothetical protein [Nocardia asteroides]|uniref:hypothetical protein n=1 Tax=Nocardia asteroides TaxID=1824 RepID=UPI003409BB15